MIERPERAGPRPAAASPSMQSPYASTRMVLIHVSRMDGCARRPAGDKRWTSVTLNVVASHTGLK
jgi:hypothetical protein